MSETELRYLDGGVKGLAGEVEFQVIDLEDPDGAPCNAVLDYGEGSTFAAILTDCT